MTGLPARTRIWIAAGVTDLRLGFTGLSGMVQMALKENPFSGQVFVFRPQPNAKLSVELSNTTRFPISSAPISALIGEES
jgi:transposase